MHVHVHGPSGEAKFWLEPKITLAQNYGLTAQHIKVVQAVIEAHEDEIRKAWKAHFSR